MCVFGVAGQLAAQPFSARRTINTADVLDCRAIVAGDGDGDQDVATAALTVDRFVWNRNGDSLGGTPGSFGSALTIQDGALANGAAAIRLVNWDNDGDVDVITGADGSDSESVNAFSSNGEATPTWTKTTTASVDAGDDVDGVQGLFVGDINGNTFADVLVASRFSNALVYIQNDSGTWATPETVDGALDGGRSPYAFDLDNDGDLDLLSTASHESGGGFF